MYAITVVRVPSAALYGPAPAGIEFELLVEG